MVRRRRFQPDTQPATSISPQTSADDEEETDATQPPVTGPDVTTLC